MPAGLAESGASQHISPAMRMRTLVLVAWFVGVCGPGELLAAPGDGCAGVWTAEDLPGERVALAGEGPAIVYSSWEPRVLELPRNDAVTLTAVIRGVVKTVVLDQFNGMPRIPLALIAPDTYQVSIPVSRILDGYRPGRLQHEVGRLQGRDGEVLRFSKNISINVRPTGVPDVEVVPLAADAQATAHILNLRRDEPWLGTGDPISAEIANRFYQFQADDFDFIAIVGNVHPTSNRFYSPVRNDVTGIGLPLFDRSGSMGSAGRLQGVIAFPIPTLFDLGGHGAVHEIGHRWINHLRDLPVLAPGVPHWPISDMANGIMGWSTPDGVGVHFPFRLMPDRNGDYLLRRSRLTDIFHDLELYLMGLTAAESVDDHLVFLNQDQRDQVHSGGTLQGPVAWFSTQDLMDALGPRVPPAGASQTDFRLASIVLSAGRLLRPGEMAFFDHMAARGEAHRALRAANDSRQTTVRPLFVATARKATLTTTLTSP
jgi:hypothetical protein